MLTVPTEVAENRLETCKGCPDYRPEKYTCSQCGCLMPLKVKFKYSKCPVGRWEEIISNDI